MNDQDLFAYPRGRLQAADLDLAASLQAMVQKEVIDKRLELKEDYDALLEPSLAKLMAEVGLQKMFWPEKLGGEEHNEPAASYTDRRRPGADRHGPTSAWPSWPLTPSPCRPLSP